MSKLYSEKLINDMWEIRKVTFEKEDPTYILENLKEGYKYEFTNTAGFEQISEYEFLIYRKREYGDFYFSRYELKNKEPKKLFETIIMGYENITDDKLLLYLSGNRVKDVYSISSNGYVKEAGWLSWGSRVTRDDDSLIFHKNIRNSLEEVIFNVDYKTFKPGSICYSTYSRDFINISSKEDIDSIIERDLRSIQKDEAARLEAHNELVSDAITKIKELSK